MANGEHPVRLWSGVVIGTIAALGTGWGLFVKMEQYDLALVSLGEQVGDLHTLIEQNDKRLGQENEDWWEDDKAQHAAVMDQFRTVISTQQQIRASQGEIVATASMVRQLAADHRNLHEAILDVGADIQFALGKHEGQHEE